MCDGAEMRRRPWGQRGHCCRAPVLILQVPWSWHDTLLFYIHADKLQTLYCMKLHLYKSKCKQNHNPCKYNMKFYMFRPHCPRFQPRTRTQSSAGSALASGIRDSNCCDSVGQRSQFGPLLGSVVDGKKEFSISREARFSHVLSSTFVWTSSAFDRNRIVEGFRPCLSINAFRRSSNVCLHTFL